MMQGVGDSSVWRASAKRMAILRAYKTDTHKLQTIHMMQGVGVSLGGDLESAWLGLGFTTPTHINLKPYT